MNKQTKLNPPSAMRQIVKNTSCSLAIAAASFAFNASVSTTSHSHDQRSGGDDRSSATVWTSASSFGSGGTGAFSATAYFPQNTAQTSSARKALTSRGGTDIFVAKYDRTGKLKWLNQASGPADDKGFDIAFDAAGNAYVTGVTFDNALFRGANHTDQTVTAVGQSIFIAKYASSGELSWVQIGTNPYGSINEGYGIAVEPIAGSVYVTGICERETMFSSADGSTHTIAGPPPWHMCVAKYDVAGNFQWSQSNAASGNSKAHKVAVDADDNAYVTGWMEGQTTFYSNDGQDLTVYGFSGPGGFPYPGDAFVVKYDENGNAEWVNHIGGYKATGTDIATSRDGKVSVTGYVGNIGNSAPEQAVTIVTSQPGGSSINLGGGKFTEPYNPDAFVATWDDDGVLLSAQRFGGMKNEGGLGIAYDRRGNLILEGVFQDSIKIGGRTLTGTSAVNLFIAKFGRDERMCRSGDMNDSGALTWIKGANGPFIANVEEGPRIGLTAQGDVLVTGAYQPTAQFGSFRLQSTGAEDGFFSLLNTPEDEKRRRHDN